MTAYPLKAWDGSAWVNIAAQPADLSDYSPINSPTFTGTPAAPTATSGTSTTQIATTAFATTANNLKANIASPTFTGIPVAPTAATNVSTTQLATTAFVQNQTSYGQFNKIAGQTMANGFDTILLDESVFTKGISLSSNALTFSLAGVYFITIGFRFGTASDAWTGVRMFNATVGEVGKSFGTGNVINDPGPANFSFMANITNISVPYLVQTFRGGATMAVATPNTDAGRSFVVTVHKVS